MVGAPRPLVPWSFGPLVLWLGGRASSVHAKCASFVHADFIDSLAHSLTHSPFVGHMRVKFRVGRSHYNIAPLLWATRG